MLAGVAGGLGAHLGINAWWLRWAFILLTIFGGSGALLYIAAWLLIPDAHEEETAVSRWLSSLDLTDAGTIFGVVLIGAGAVILGSQVFHISGAFIAAAVLFAVGVMLYRGDLRPSPKTPPTPPAPEGTYDTGEDPKTGAPSTEEVAGEAVAATEMEAPREPVAAATAAAEVLLPPPPPPPQAQPPPPSRPPRPPRERSMLGRFTMAMGLIVLSTMALLDVSGISIGTVDFGDLFEPAHYVGVALLIVAIGLVVGAFIGRARWLIFVGIFILPALLVTSLWPKVFNWSAGEFLHHPTDVAEVDTSYELGAGQLTVDLTGLDAAELADIARIEASVGFGELRILVPGDVGVLLEASVGLGDIDVPGPDQEGIGASMVREFGPPPVVLVIDAEVGAGQIKLLVVEAVGSSS